MYPQDKDSPQSPHERIADALEQIADHLADLLARPIRLTTVLEQPQNLQPHVNVAVSWCYCPFCGPINRRMNRGLKKTDKTDAPEIPMTGPRSSMVCSVSLPNTHFPAGQMLLIRWSTGEKDVYRVTSDLGNGEYIVRHLYPLEKEPENTCRCAYCLSGLPCPSNAKEVGNTDA